MGFAYSNNGLSWRAWDDPNALANGEIYFDLRPTDSQLISSFPGYTDAKAKADLKEEAGSALLVGLTVLSTGTPAINGTYGVGATSLTRINAVSTYIMVNAKFPIGLSEFPMLDTDGMTHLFPNISLFQAWATAIADYVATLDMILLTGTGSIPPSTVTIT